MSITDIYNELVKDVWANPHADRNSVFKVDLLTTRVGSVGSYYSDLGFDLDLPTNDRQYVLLSLGVYLPYSFGIKNYYDGWNPISDLIHFNQSVISIFTQGRMFTFINSYFTVLKNGMVIIAVDTNLNKKQLSLNSDIYVRFYTNEAVIDNPSIPQIEVRSYLHGVDDYDNFITVVSRINQLLNTFAQVYKNGILYQNDIPLMNNLSNGDTIDVILDPFVIGVNTFNLNSDDTFYSLKDGVTKRLIGITGPNSNTYVDDIELYVTGVNNSGDRIGIYYPRLSEDELRALTPKDYAVDAVKLDQRLNTFLTFDDTGSLSQYEVLLYRRTNLKNKPLLLDSSRIPDLINLPVNVRHQLMLGLNSNLDFWQAHNLEACRYNTFLSTTYSNLNPSIIVGVFSHYGISSLIEQVNINKGKANLPLSSIGKTGKLLRFDTDGFNPELIDYNTPIASLIAIQNSLGVEQFLPLADFTSPLDVVIESGITLMTEFDESISVLCYYLDGGILTKAELNVDYFIYKDVTGTYIQWHTSMYPYKRFIRFGNKVVCYTKQLNHIQLTNGFNVYNGRVKEYDIGMKNLYVWLNGKYLIEDLDYVLVGEIIHLTSIPPGFDLNDIQLFVLYAGLNHELRRVKNTTWGWVKHGKLDNDPSYNLLMYRNNLLFAGGKVVKLENFITNDVYVDNQSMVDPSIVDGVPYAIVQPPYFLSEAIIGDICVPFTTDEYIDGEIKQIVSTFYPPVEDNTPIVIPSKYYLVSILMNKITEEILNGNLVIANMVYSALEIRELLLPYMVYLRDDPCLKNHNEAFVEIRPRWSETPVGLTPNQYNFIESVNQTLLNGKVEGIQLYYYIQP